MQVSIIKIGNSRGIRLSKTLLERYQIKDTVKLILEKDHIIIKPRVEPRQGWKEAFKQMHESGGDKPLMNDVFVDEIFEEWD